MNFTAAEAQQLNVAVALKIEANRIEIGQRLSFLIFLPVVRVPSQQDVGAGRVVRDIEGAEDGCLLLGRMGGENGDLIKEAFESCHRSGKGDDHRVRRRCLDDDLAIAGAERVAGGRVQLRIHQCFHGVSDIFGGEWRAIGEMQTASETE